MNRNPILSRAIVLLALFVLTVASAGAQSDAPTFGETIDVRVINLEVVVTQKGQRVEARGPDDFVLRLVARTTAHENELTQRLPSAPHVVTVKTIQVIRTAKSTPGVPIDVNQGLEPAAD